MRGGATATTDRGASRSDHRRASLFGWALALGCSLALLPGTALAHGESASPGIDTLWLGWEFDPFILIPLAAGVAFFVYMVRRVNRAHPTKPVPAQRVAWFWLGIAAIVLALASPIATYDDELLTSHMVQHMLLTVVAPPLLLLAAPFTVLLRFSSARVRHDWLRPIMHSHVLKGLLFPVFTWLVFVVTLWATHFSPLYNASVENVWLHRFEHALYFWTGMLFWWPVVQADPGPWRVGHPARVIYLALAMAQAIFLGLAITSAGEPLYDAYVEAGRTWGPSVLSDQQLAGAIMWVGSAMMFLGAILFVVYDWMREEERRTERSERLERRRREAATPAPRPGLADEA